MLTLVTVIYGNNPRYRAELFGSVLSILKMRESATTRIVVYTDRALDDFPLAVTERIISADEWREWTRNSDLTHLVKLQLLWRTLEESGHPVIYFDTDTLFMVSPEQLAARLSPGTALMHANEGPISKHKIWSRIVAWLGSGREVEGVKLSPHSIMHNSGIVGVVPEHMTALKKSARIADALQAIDPLFSLDQFATGNALGQQARILSCEKEVLHYWGWDRSFVRQAIEQFRDNHRDAAPATLCQLFMPANFGKIPAIHWQDKLHARWLGTVHGLNADARFAWLALYSAIRHGNASPDLANLWFAVHLNFLQAASPRSDHLHATLSEKYKACAGWLDPTHQHALALAPSAHAPSL